ncbi:MAG: substrate-binding domain-containing protein [Planctomycetia bacterium]
MDASQDQTCPRPAARPHAATIALLLGDGPDAHRESARGVIDFAHEGRDLFPPADGPKRLPAWLPALPPDWSILLDADAATVAAQADGIIGVPADPRFVEVARRGRLPAVAIGHGQVAGGQPSLGVTTEVRCDRSAAIGMAVAELVACGARSLALLPEREDDPQIDAFHRHARAARRAAHVAAAATRTTAALAKTAAWCGSLPGPVGIVATTDRQAAWLLDGLQAAGLSVPGDLFLVGIGNDDLVCEAARPTLTSVDPGHRRLGVAAAAVLHAALTNRPRLPRRLELAPMGLVRRRSTAGLVAFDGIVAEAVQQLHAGLASDLTPAGLARRVGLSRAWLDERFRRAFGRTVHEQIVHVKVTELKRLLGERSRPLADVAAACGFGSTQYLTTFFKKHVGMTPGQFRERVDRGLEPASPR